MHVAPRSLLTGFLGAVWKSFTMFVVDVTVAACSSAGGDMVMIACLAIAMRELSPQRHPPTTLALLC